MVVAYKSCSFVVALSESDAYVYLVANIVNDVLTRVSMTADTRLY